MLIKENTVCYTSQFGHKNFIYPSDTKLVIKANCIAQYVSWISGGGKIPIKVLKSCLMPLDINDKTKLDVSPPTKDEYTIVWIEKRV
jgi:hypothetical protein|tara:strand:- start:640 stop:900 length:261 start_codon:yes stop_codon:yes gene_type:complete